MLVMLAVDCGSPRDDITSASSLTVFCRKLKVHLLSYGNSLYILDCVLSKTESAFAILWKQFV